MRSSVALLAILVATGCVSAKKYRALESDYADLKLQFDAATAKSEGLRLEVNELEEHVSYLRERNDYLGSFYEDLLLEFRPQLENDEAQLIVYPDRMSLALAQDVSFNTASSSLTSTGKETLKSLADLIQRHPERRFVVEGHTDNVPISTERYESNWELGAARAVAVVKALIAQGVPADQLAAASYGDTEPLANNESPDGRRTNRRVEISFQPTLEELPGHAALLGAAKQVTYAEGADSSVIPELSQEPAQRRAKQPEERGSEPEEGDLGKPPSAR